MSAKELRWHDTLVLMNMDLIHKLDCDNVGLDALSRKEEFHAMSRSQVLRLMYKGEGNLERKIRERYMKDSKAQTLLDEFGKERSSKTLSWQMDCSSINKVGCMFLKANLDCWF